MTTDHNHRPDPMLRRLDRPVAPDPRFAEQLRRQVLPAAGPPRAPIPMGGTPVPTRPARPRRRWFDAAAVAVLCLGLMGGMAGLAPTRDDAASVVEAPLRGSDAVVPSAAGGGRFPGPGPAASAYELAWSTGRGQPVVFGDTVYLTRSSRDAPFADLEAHDLRSGEIRWARQTTALLAPVVAPEGVVVGIPEVIAASPPTEGTPGPAAARRFHPALLSHGTGEVLWQTDHPLVTGLASVVVADEAVVVATDAGRVVAFDRRTGEERWTYTYRRVVPDGVLPSVCVPGSCFDRATYPVELAARDGLLYVADPVTVDVVALGVADGSVRWRVDVAARTGSATVFYAQLAAVRGGVVVLIDDWRTVEQEDAPRHYGLWSAEAGDERWRGSLPRASPFPVATEGSLYLAYGVPGRGCCQLAEVSLATGAVEWTSSGAPLPFWVEGYLAEPGTVVVALQEGVPRVVGMDARSHETLWEFAPRQYGCSHVYLPLAGDGTFVCGADAGDVRVMRPVDAAIATPPGSTQPAASPAAENAQGPGSS